jgi:PAS domain S-box-containing protein
VDDIINDQILDELPESLILLDDEGKVLYYNKGAASLEQLTQKPFKKGVDFTELVSLERKETVTNILKTVRSNRILQVSEAEYKDASGRSYFFEVTYKPIQIGGTNQINICVISHDITHHKTFEKKSIQLLEEITRLIEDANALIFSVDSREYITEWNKECIRLTHYEKNEVLAQKIGLVIDEQSQQDFAAVFKNVISGASVSNQEFLIRTKDQNRVTVLVNATPKFTSSKNVVGALFVGQDITELSQYRFSLEEKVKDRTEELKQALAKEKELVELKNKFVSVASHEFKIPLSAIDSSVSFLKGSSSLPPEERLRLNNIETQVGHMKSLLEDVLTIKKSDDNKLKATYKKINLIDFLNKLSDEVVEGSRNTHEIHKQFSSPEIMIDSDEKLLRNIFLNIMSNAIKFSPQRNSINLSVDLIGSKIQIKVADQGIGIDEQDLKRVFEPFNRGSNASEIKGTGLGLSIVKRAVETLSGTLDVNSALNKGTTVTVLFNQYQSP